MVTSLEYSIELPFLYQLKGSSKVLLGTKENDGASDVLGNFFPLDQLEPIPLSFWWLRVFGFKYVHNKFLQEYALENAQGQKFGVYRDAEARWLCKMNDELWEITSVNELQDVYARFRHEYA